MGGGVVEIEAGGEREGEAGGRPETKRAAASNKEDARRNLRGGGAGVPRARVHRVRRGLGVQGGSRGVPDVVVSCSFYDRGVRAWSRA